MFKKLSTKEKVQAGVKSADPSKPVRETKEKKNIKVKNPRKKTSWGNLLKSRKFAGIACITLAAVIGFGGIPLMRSQLIQTETVLEFTGMISAGERIEENDVREIERSALNLSDDLIRTKEDAVGKYLTVDTLEGDYVTKARLSAIYPSDNPVLANLPEGKMAVSVTLPSMSQSLSSKLRQGDIVQMFAVTEEDEYIAMMPPELQFVEVLDVSDGAGLEVSKTAENVVDTIVVAVNREQAQVLIAMQHSQIIHPALVIRGDEEAKTKALAVQESYFDEPSEENIEHEKEGG